MELDDILIDIGEYGPYQKRLLFYVFLPCMFPCAFHAYNQLFMTCTDCCHRNTEANFSSYNCSDGYDAKLEFALMKSWLICESDFRLMIALILFGIAGFIGCYFFGYLQDRIGRRPSFFIYLLIESVFGIATAFASDYWTWIFYRFGVGLTVPAILSTPYVLPIELVGPKYRTRCTVYSNMAYSVALVSLAVIVFTFRNWRILSIVTTIPFLSFFIYWWYMPESPRWLLTTGKFDEAMDILKKMAKTNGKEINDEYIRLTKAAYTADMGNHSLEESIKYGVKDLFRYPVLRRKTIIITFIWYLLTFVNTSVYVGLSYYAPALTGDKFLNFFLAGVAELPTYAVLWPAMERNGRREILCLSMLIGGIACVFTALPYTNDNVTLFLYCIGKMGISSSYVVLPLFASELFPTVVRGVGMSVGSVAGMLGPIIIPIVNYWGIGSRLPLILMGLMLIIGGLFSFGLPETKNTHLPETITESENIR